MDTERSLVLLEDAFHHSPTSDQLTKPPRLDSRPRAVAIKMVKSAEVRENDRIRHPSSKHRRLLEMTPTIRASINKLRARRPASLPQQGAADESPITTFSSCTPAAVLHSSRDAGTMVTRSVWTIQASDTGTAPVVCSLDTCWRCQRFSFTVLANAKANALPDVAIHH